MNIRPSVRRQGTASTPLPPKSLSSHLYFAMATAAVLAPHDVPTHLNYYAPIGKDAPFQYVYDPPAGEEKHNLGEDTHPTVIHDARGKVEEYGLSLDTSGFQFVNHTSSVKGFTDKATIEGVYYKEVEEILKKEAGAKRVFIFDHTIRYRTFYKYY